MVGEILQAPLAGLCKPPLLPCLADAENFSLAGFSASYAQALLTRDFFVGFDFSDPPTNLLANNNASGFSSKRLLSQHTLQRMPYNGEDLIVSPERSVVPRAKQQA